MAALSLCHFFSRSRLQLTETDTAARLYVVLEMAPLETIKVSTGLLCLSFSFFLIELL